ncbi:hypothetical protein G7Y89_g14520 [Cudoniella acicularis]|uniref:Glycosyl transferase CAP10 domain-containing protein n=1 Tax=Cudoniella acicularis TaxID=354080 RepID=A0A8H4VT58_9HELO|nr:hypothetical protein G7Y89_g14520 [Cudoniella acicularis]
MVSPLLRLSGKEIIKIMSDVQNFLDIDLWFCSFSGANAKTHCSHPTRTFDRHIGLLFDKMFENLPGVLPDIKFLANHLDEPRVLTPPRLMQGGDSSGKRQFRVTDLSRRPTWNAITRYCASQQSNESTQTKPTLETFSLPFVTDRSSDIDLCQHPEYSNMHGLLISPTSFSLIEGLVPILSTGSPSTMGDLLFPSPAYIESEFRYDETHDIEWDKKQNNLYWAGSNTGGFSVDEQWRSYHRQRFVTLAQNLGKQQQYYLREKDGIISPSKSSFLNGRLYNVAFTRILQCTPTPCHSQTSYFHLKPWASKDRALSSKLVFDLDGNGISGRYYKLLASHSAPLKQTLFREWHDERLVPWVHYIPVSQSLEEVPELTSTLEPLKEGRARRYKNRLNLNNFPTIYASFIYSRNNSTD